MDFRIGFGHDVHQLKTGEEFWLGGIQINFEKGALGHSDADVLIHAICDALLGALCLSDIGTLFPDNDPKYKGVDSKILLKKTYSLIEDEGYTLGNIDSTICLEKPKIKDYIPEMRRTLSNVIDTDISNISIKATTHEKMSFVGSGAGISAYAVVLLKKEKE